MKTADQRHLSDLTRLGTLASNVLGPQHPDCCQCVTCVALDAETANLRSATNHEDVAEATERIAAIIAAANAAA